MLGIEKCHWFGAPGEANPSEELKLKRKSIGVVVKSFFSPTEFDSNASLLARCPPPVLDAMDSALPESFGVILKSLNITNLSSVQMQCWPAILAGANIVG